MHSARVKSGGNWLCRARLGWIKGKPKASQKLGQGYGGSLRRAACSSGLPFFCAVQISRKPTRTFLYRRGGGVGMPCLRLSMNPKPCSSSPEKLSPKDCSVHVSRTLWLTSHAHLPGQPCHALISYLSKSTHQHKTLFTATSWNKILKVTSSCLFVLFFV